MSTSTAKDLAMRLCKSSFRGFTLVELVAVLIITSILALVVLPRFFDRQAFDARIQYDQAQSVLRYAQKIAIAQNRNVHVRMDGAGFTFCFDPFAAGGACSTPVPAATAQDGSTAALAVPIGLAYSVTPAIQGFYFNALGKPFNSADFPPNSSFVKADISLTGGGEVRHIFIESETGFVHP